MNVLTMQEAEYIAEKVSDIARKHPWNHITVTAMISRSATDDGTPKLIIQNEPCGTTDIPRTIVLIR